MVSAAAFVGICALILSAPFEASRPLLQLPWQSISSVEAVLLVVLAAWGVAAVWSRRMPTWRTPLTSPWIVLLLAMIVAALVAPANRTNAVHMVGRLALAFGVYLVTVSGVTTPARLRIVFITGLVAGFLVAVLAVLEFVGVTVVLQALRAFRPGLAVVGAQVRAAGPFQYPTIASMYLEIVFAFALGLIPLAIDARRPLVAAVVMIVIALIAEAIILTYTRTGLLTMAASLAMVGAWRCRRQGFDRCAVAIAAIAALIVIQTFTSHSIESVRLRLTSEGQSSWYHAEINAPTELTAATASVTTVPVTLTNTGQSPWDPHAEPPFRFSYHWLLSDEDRIVSWEGLRTEFPVTVLPGDTVSLPARVEAPGQPGRYRLLWDVEQQHRLWFSSEPDAQLFVTRVAVSGPLISRPQPLGIIRLPKQAIRPGRLTLWRAGARMLAAHPLFGVGADNFRLVYGDYAGIANADPRVHSNDMYIEMLVGGGLVGGLAFAWLCWRALTEFGAAFRRAFTSDTVMASAPIAAAGAAIALHGLVDSFLSFTATYVLFAITLGLAVASNAWTSHAHRL